MKVLDLGNFLKQKEYLVFLIKEGYLDSFMNCEKILFLSKLNEFQFK
jgi:hypothetical protein